MEVAINLLKDKNAIVECQNHPGQFLSHYFLAPKSDGSDRFILNLKELNKFLEYQHFQLEDFRTAIKLVDKDYFMCTLDLKDAYFLVPVHKNFRIYLRFRFKNVLYEFTCLPFGLSCCPIIFTKIMKPVTRYLRSRGWPSVLYIDDFLIPGEDEEICIKNVNYTIELLEWLGFIINYIKSELNPSRHCKFLGLMIDTKILRTYLPPEKITNITKNIRKLLNKRVCTVQELAELIGKLISACPAVEYGLLYTRFLERTKILALEQSEGDFGAKTNLSHDAKTELYWWLTKVDSYNSIKDSLFAKTIFTDASKTGGVVLMVWRRHMVFGLRTRANYT